MHKQTGKEKTNLIFSLFFFLSLFLIEAAFKIVFHLLVCL